TAGALACAIGLSHEKSAVVAPAPSSCAAMKLGASVGRIPANVSLAERASVTAGLANEVDEVNQYADVMYAATANGVIAGRERTVPQMVASRPKVAMTSLASCAKPARAWLDAKNSGSPNMTCAAATPANAPAPCAIK